MSSIYADVIVDITHEKLDRSFQYRIPPELAGKIVPGSQVKIPFGNGNRSVTGYVLSVGNQAKYDESRMKTILGLSPDGAAVEAHLIALADWMRHTYGSTMIQALRTVLPVKTKAKGKRIREIELLVTEEAAQELFNEYERKKYKAKARLLAELLKKQVIDYHDAVSVLGISANTLRSMEEQKIIRVCRKNIWRNPVELPETEAASCSLSREQQLVIEGVKEEWRQKGRPCLISGVTGSGKTQVYMELIAETIARGRQAIVLIPEIALTYQNVARFCARFREKVTMVNSRMTREERADQMERARLGEVQIMIGPRSALFTPFPDLGLIIIDEEHETSYKSETTPRYHARETAVYRARLEGARVVMGSATPSVDAFYLCEKGEYALFRMQTRYGKAMMPKVWIADMREELKQGNRSILSRKLQQEMEEHLSRGEQVILFLNRRGYAGYVSCRSCGYVMKCPHCDVSLTAHNNGKLICHYCGYEREQTTHCPSCGSPYIGGFRAGTQQIEQIIKKTFPGKRILRMDGDTTKRKDSYDEILGSFAKGEADILIGTQMIVKGHDFPNVTLVGVLLADLSLNADHYRAGERTFQLLTQAVGRAGRGAKEGMAVIQTYHPEHYSIVSAVSQDYDAFYREEIEYRRLLGYPPASNLMAIHGACEEEEHLREAMEYVKRFLIRINHSDEVQMIGPAKESVAKISDLYRMVLYVKAADQELLLRQREKLEQYIEINKGFQSVYIQFDFNA